jgi:glutaredoxin domain-containing cysteine-rich protein 1
MTSSSGSVDGVPADDDGITVPFNGSTVPNGISSHRNDNNSHHNSNGAPVAALNGSGTAVGGSVGVPPQHHCLVSSPSQRLANGYAHAVPPSETATAGSKCCSSSSSCSNNNNNSDNCRGTTARRPGTYTSPTSPQHDQPHPVNNNNSQHPHKDALGSTDTGGTTVCPPNVRWRHPNGLVQATAAGQPLRTATDGGGVDDLVDHPFFAAMVHDGQAADDDEAVAALQIVSAKGTVRGVRNRVRAGIAAFVESHDGKKRKDYRTAEKGKVVLFTTSVMIVRETYDRCLRVKKILQTHMVRFEERDVSLSRDNHRELVERLGIADLPQVFADGLHIGGADDVERLNENGTLRRIFQHFQMASSTTSCPRCGGFRYTPCSNCHGSKKSRRNNFTQEFCALRCTVCDDNGLVMCDLCSNHEVSSSAL